MAKPIDPCSGSLLVQYQKGKIGLVASKDHDLRKIPPEDRASVKYHRKFQTLTQSSSPFLFVGPSVNHDQNAPKTLFYSFLSCALHISFLSFFFPLPYTPACLALPCTHAWAPDLAWAPDQTSHSKLVCQTCHTSIQTSRPLTKKNTGTSPKRKKKQQEHHQKK